MHIELENACKIPVNFKLAKMPFSIDILCNSDKAVLVTCECATEIIDDGKLPEC